MYVANKRCTERTHVLFANFLSHHIRSDSAWRNICRSMLVIHTETEPNTQLTAIHHHDYCSAICVHKRRSFQVLLAGRAQDALRTGSNELREMPDVIVRTLALQRA